MLGVLVNPGAEGNPDFTRQNIPGVSISNSKKINSLGSPRFLKSHTWFRKDIPRAVYLVRDGRDVLISLYHYYITRQKKTVSFSDFFYGYINGKYGQLWYKNVESWLLNGKELLGDNLLVLTFEEMKADTSKTLTRAAEFLGLPAGNAEVEQALRHRISLGCVRLRCSAVGKLKILMLLSTGEGKPGSGRITSHTKLKQLI